MKSFRQYVNEYKLNPVSSKSTGLCGPTSLQAFGICVNDSRAVLKTHEIINHLEGAGYKVHPRPRFAFRGYSLGQFMEEHQSGMFILATSNHVMAYIDGELTDTNHSKRALTKKLQEVYEVTR